MPVSFNLLAASLASTSNQSTAYTGTAGNALANEVLISFVSVSGNTSSGTMSGGGLSWNGPVASQGKNANADICLVFWAFVSSNVSVTPSYTPSAAATGCIMSVIRVSGSTATLLGLDLRQAIATATGTTANPTVTFGSATLTNNGILLFAANGTNSTTQFTAPTGFTELSEVAYNNPTNGGQVSSLSSGGTATTYTWTNANTTSWRTFGLEFTEATATSFDPFGMMGFFGI